jgi:hypothetical protein
MPLMPGVQRRGLGGLIDSLSDEILRRGTGALDVAGHGMIYVVFGHPLHATAGALTGLAAVDALGTLLRDGPDLEVLWLPGTTAGRAHSLAPSDDVVRRLRGDDAGHSGSPGADQPAAADMVGNLNLRRMISEETATSDQQRPVPDELWAGVAVEVCAVIEAGLHLHARPLTEVIRAAPPDPAAILLAIERARAIPVRAVSRSLVGKLLTEAETLVRERARSA